MASITRDKSGGKRLQFVASDGTRKAIRFGDVPMKTAEAVKIKVESILAAQATGVPLDAETSRWLGGLDQRLHDRLARVGLAMARETAEVRTFGVMLDEYFRLLTVKESTRMRMGTAKALMLLHFKADRDVGTIGVADVEDWRAGLVKDGYAVATIARMVVYGRQIFKWAMRRGYVSSNPFTDVRAGSQANSTKAFYVDRPTIAKVLDAAPDDEWRLLIALSRFGGLRVPSEALVMTWADVDWEHNRLTIRSPKTEHHEGKAERVIPLFPEIREHLQRVYDEAPEGSVYVVSRYREGANLNPQLRRIIKRAGLKPWARTWHNLRASRQTELAATFPLHTVCAWIGNSKAIAAGHYLQVTDADWTRAVGSAEQSGAESGAQVTQKQAQHASAPSRRASSAIPKNDSNTAENQGKSGFSAGNTEIPEMRSMVATGLEPVTPVV